MVLLGQVLDDGSARLGAAAAFATAAAPPKIKRRRANNIMLSYLGDYLRLGAPVTLWR